MKHLLKATYEAPMAEVMVVKMESGILGGSIDAERSSYGTASEGDGTMQEWF